MGTDGFRCADLAAAVCGDMAAFERVHRQLHSTLLRCQQAGLGLTVTPGAVRAVLSGLRAGSVRPAQARAWAFFVRSGYAGGWSYPDPGVAHAEAVPDTAQYPIRALDIDFDPVAEDAIAEALSRLDDLEDPFAEAAFGRLTEAEIDALLQMLPEQGTRP